MKVSKFKEMARIEEWKSLIARRLESKLSVSDWCKQNDITEQQYYYRLRRVSETILDDLETQSSSLIRYPFFQPPLTSSTTKEGTNHSDKIIVRYGDTVLEFPETTEVGTIANLIKELSR